MAARLPKPVAHNNQTESQSIDRVHTTHSAQCTLQTAEKHRNLRALSTECTENFVHSNALCTECTVHH